MNIEILKAGELYCRLLKVYAIEIHEDKSFADDNIVIARVLKSLYRFPVAPV